MKKLLVILFFLIFALPVFSQNDPPPANSILPYNVSIITRALNQAGWAYKEKYWPAIRKYVDEYFPSIDLSMNSLKPFQARKIVRDLYGKNKEIIDPIREDGTSVKDIFNNLKEYLYVVEDSLFSEAVRIEMDLVSESKSGFRTLSKGWNYTICAMVEHDKIDDFDVSIYREDNGKWNLIETINNSGKEFAFVGVTPETDGLYQITIKVNKFKEGYKIGRYTLTFFHD
jgi:hypothetical protein